MSYLLYSSDNCAYCNTVKSIMKSQSIDFIEYNISRDPHAKEFILTEGHRTVPQLYNKFNKHLASGYDEIIKHLGIR